MSRDESSLYDDCHRMIAALGLPSARDPRADRWDLDRLVARAEQTIGHRILWVPADIPPRWLCGLSLLGPALDIIIHPRGESVHSRQTRLHELAHVLFRDHSSSAATHQILRTLLPDVDESLIHGVSARVCDYDDVTERRAETLATMIGGALNPLSHRGWRRGPQPRTHIQDLLDELFSLPEHAAATP